MGKDWSLADKQERQERVLAHLYLNPGWHRPGEVCKALGLLGTGAMGILLKEMAAEGLLESETRWVKVQTKAPIAGKRSTTKLNHAFEEVIGLCKGCEYANRTHSRKQHIYRIARRGKRQIKEILRRANAAAEGNRHDG